MISKGLRLGTLLRLALIFMTMAALAWLVQQENFRAASVGVGLFLMAETWWLIIFLERPLRQVDDFFNALHYEDLSYKFTPKVHTQLSQQLATNMHNIQQRLRELHQHKQEQTHYYSLLLERVPVALLVMEGEQVTLLNNAATSLLQRSGFASFTALAQTHPDLARALQLITPGEKCRAELQLDAEGTSQTLSLSATQLSLASGVKKLVSLQLIQQELDEQEIHAWQNLVQVFTHEIMNSMTPVTSLSQTAQTLLEELEQEAKQTHKTDSRDAQANHALHSEKLQDAHQAVATVTRRAQHLLAFVQAYRQVLNPPTPQFASVQLQPLLQHVLELFEPQAKAHNIQLSCSCNPPSLSINADAALLEQALINLLKNALESLAEKSDGHIQLSASINTHNAPIIEIKDNGGGINPDQLDKIFIPFYTSKRAGTGIGLFLVKQIMQAHRGSVYALPNLKQGAVIKLVF